MVPAYPANMSMASYPPYQTSFPPTTSFAHMPSVALPGNMADFAAQGFSCLPFPVCHFPPYDLNHGAYHQDDFSSQDSQSGETPPTATIQATEDEKVKVERKSE